MNKLDKKLCDLTVNNCYKYKVFGIEIKKLNKKKLHSYKR